MRRVDEFLMLNGESVIEVPPNTMPDRILQRRHLDDTHMADELAGVRKGSSSTPLSSFVEFLAT